MQKLTAAVKHRQPDSTRSPAPHVAALDVAAQQTFLQDLQQHDPAQLAAQLLSWLQAWPDLADALLSARIASSRVQVAVDSLWQDATTMLTFLLEAVHQQAAADSGTQNPWLELLEQLVGPCCTAGAPCLLELTSIMHIICWLVDVRDRECQFAPAL
jgi:hypothetical protein